MRCKYIIGSGLALDLAMATWQEVDPDLDVRPLEIGQDKWFRFDLRILDGIEANEDTTAFVAFDNQFLNFRRFELMGELKERGFSMPPLASPSALIASTAVIGQNAFIGAGAIIGHRAHIGFNSVIGSGANIGSNSRIGASTWIEAGVIIGNNAKIGTNTTLTHGVILAPGVEIGKLCVVDKPGKIVNNIASKTFIHSSFDTPIVTVEL